MKTLAIALVAFTMISAPALATDPDDTADAPALVDDTTFDAQFQCPETIADPDERVDEFARYVAWAKEVHPDWGFRKRLDVRYGLLRRHGCAVTLAKIASSERPPFGP